MAKRPSGSKKFMINAGIKIDKNITNVQDELNKIKGLKVNVDIKEDFKSISSTLTSINKKLDTFATKIKDIKTNVSDLNNNNKLGSLINIAVSPESIDSVERLQRAIKSLNSESDPKGGGSKTVSSAYKDIERLGNQLNTVSKKYESFNEINSRYLTGSDLTSWNAIADEIKNLKSVMYSYEYESEDIHKGEIKLIKEKIANLKEQQDILNKTRKINLRYPNSVDYDFDGDYSNANLEKYFNSLGKGKAVLSSFTNGTNIAGSAFDTYSASIKSADGNLQRATLAVNKFTGETRMQIGVADNASKKLTSATDKIGFKMSELLTYFASVNIISRFFSELSRGVGIIKEIDDAMTSLRKVTDETEASYNKFYKTSSDIGVSIGRTKTEVINATAEFAKLGYDLDKAVELGERALVLTNIGDNMSFDQSIESITSTIKGFNMDYIGENVVENSQKIIDSFNKVSNEFAVSTTDITEGVKRASATLNQAGVSFDQTLGLITGATEVLQEVESASNGLVILSQRIRGVSDDGEDLSDLRPKLEKMFKGKGLTLLTDTGDLKDTYTILKDVNSVWDELIPTERQYWGEQLAGKNRIKVLNALMQNWDAVEKATKASINSAGSALEENEKYLNSISGKISIFTTEVQSMWSNALPSEVIGDFVDFGTQIIKVIDALKLFPTAIAAVAGTISGIYNVGKHTCPNYIVMCN